MACAGQLVRNWVVTNAEGTLNDPNGIVYTLMLHMLVLIKAVFDHSTCSSTLFIRLQWNTLQCLPELPCIIDETRKEERSSPANLAAVRATRRYSSWTMGSWDVEVHKVLVVVIVVTAFLHF